MEPAGAGLRGQKLPRKPPSLPLPLPLRRERKTFTMGHLPLLPRIQGWRSPVGH